MKFKELKRVLALSLAYTLAVPSNVYAADMQVQTEESNVEIETPVLENTEENTAEQPEIPEEPETPEQPETPKQPRLFEK